MARVARSGDVTAAASAGLVFPGGTADSGSWTAGAVAEQPAATLTDTGAAALFQATCTFSFKGKVGNTPVTGSSTVTLAADATRLRVGGASLLLDGDGATDAFGNALSAGVPPGTKLDSARA